VPVRLLHFPDENHWILKPQNSRLWYREFFAWLRRFDAWRGGAAPS
jgi:dipeptidyl aminopeptidase/acylaminoacyl peptidase